MIFHKNLKVILHLICFENDLDMMFNDVLNGKKDFLDNKSVIILKSCENVHFSKVVNR